MVAKDYSKVKRTLVWVLIANLAVTVAKFIFGFLANSLSMMADAVHSLFDTLSNVIGLVAINISCKPPDREHPYGHRKYEMFATIIIAFFLFLTGFEIIQSAIGRLRFHVSPQISAITFSVMVVTLVINFFVSRYEHRIGHELDSSILVADSLHTKSDIYASISVILGFFAIRAGYPVVDSIIALFIVFLVGRTGYRIIKETSVSLVDTCVLDSKTIKIVVEKIPSVKSCHKIRARGTGSEIYVDLHITLAGATSLDKGHDISHQVAKKLKKEFKVKDVLVHIEPEK